MRCSTPSLWENSVGPWACLDTLVGKPSCPFRSVTKVIPFYIEDGQSPYINTPWCNMAPLGTSGIHWLSSSRKKRPWSRGLFCRGTRTTLIEIACHSLQPFQPKPPELAWPGRPWSVTWSPEKRDLVAREKWPGRPWNLTWSPVKYDLVAREAWPGRPRSVTWSPVKRDLVSRKAWVGRPRSVTWSPEKKRSLAAAVENSSHIFVCLVR